MSPVARIIFLTIGWLSIALATLGTVLPLLPTVPFLLLSVYCFGKSSPKLQNWLLNHKYFGPFLRDYQDGKGIPRKAKILAISMIWLSVSCSVFLLIDHNPAEVILWLTAIGVTIYLLSLPTRRPPQ